MTTTFRVKKEDDEYVVVVCIDRKRHEPSCYYAGDKEDAATTCAYMKREHEWGQDRTPSRIEKNVRDDIRGFIAAINGGGHPIDVDAWRQELAISRRALHTIMVVERKERGW